MLYKFLNDRAFDDTLPRLPVRFSFAIYCYLAHVKLYIFFCFRTSHVQLYCILLSLRCLVCISKTLLCICRIYVDPDEFKITCRSVMFGCYLFGVSHGITFLIQTMSLQRYWTLMIKTSIQQDIFAQPWFACTDIDF